MTTARRHGIDVARYVQGVVAGDRAVLAQAITLVESTKLDHRVLANELIDTLLPLAGHSERVGISGVPGAKLVWSVRLSYPPSRRLLSMTTHDPCRS